MKRICLDCDHPCHCIGQGFHTQDTYCYVTGCVCTDCNGNDSISECKIETYYFELKNSKLPKIHNTIYI